MSILLLQVFAMQVDLRQKTIVPFHRCRKPLDTNGEDSASSVAGCPPGVSFGASCSATTRSRVLQTSQRAFVDDAIGGGDVKMHKKQDGGTISGRQNRPEDRPQQHSEIVHAVSCAKPADRSLPPTENTSVVLDEPCRNPARNPTRFRKDQQDETVDTGKQTR